MPYSYLADLVLLVHFVFIVFVVLGGVLAFKWPWVVYAHLPAAIWGALIEFAGWICPLTPLENSLRRRAGESAYEGGFVAHYLEPIVYPQGWTRELGVMLGIAVILINLLIYGVLMSRRSRD